MPCSKMLRRSACALVLLLSSCAGGRADTASPPSLSLYSAFMAGRYAAATGHETTAARFYADAIALDPDNRTLLRQGFITALLARSPDATMLAKRMGNDPLAILVRGNALIEAGHDRKAATLFAKMPATGVTGLIRPLLLAWSDAGAGRFGPAIDRLTGLDAGSPFGPVYTLNAALIADLAGREAEAAPLYRAAEQAFASPNLRLAQAIASFQARQGHFQSADAILVRLAATHPDLRLALRRMERDAAKPMITSAQDGVAEVYLTLAGSLDQPQQVLLRQILLGFALQLRPDLAAASLLLANLDVTLHHPERAAATLTRIGADDPLYGPALMQRAQILAGLGKAMPLLPALADLARTHPHDAAPITLAADIERDAGHYRRARRLYSQALARLGPNPPGEAWAVYYGRAIAEDKLHDWPAADADLHHALALQPGQPFVLNYLGYSDALRGVDLAQAQTMIEEALQVDPNEGAIIDSLGYVLLREGKIAQAMRTQIRAVQEAPDDAEVNAHLADIFEAAGDHLAARNQWVRALALHPDAAEAARIEAHLKHDAAGS
ncbi:tetratricopeptide repeat protein [Acidiphilium sp.]|uniref:tetratricopeptide repeat protein n=1 Tax=Acidiphilium sp. TaxID=527 RepID=UPI003CFFAA82